MATTRGKGSKASLNARKVKLGPYAPEETIGFLIWDTIRTFHRTFQKLVSSHGINFGILAFLAGVVDAGWDRRPGTRRTRSHGRADHPQGGRHPRAPGLCLPAPRSQGLAQDACISDRQRANAIFARLARDAVRQSDGRERRVARRADRDKTAAQAHAREYGEAGADV